LRTLLPDPGADSVAGVKAPETPLGNPVTEKATAALNVEFGVVVNVTVLDAPTTTLVEVAEGTRVNVGAGATVTESATCCFTEPLVADTVAE